MSNSTDSFEIGDRVRVKNTLLYNDRIGVLQENSGAIDDIWDFTVKLDALESSSNPLDQSRIIGIQTDQIEACSMYDVKIDEKYRIKILDGNVEILRYNEPWLENPPGGKAWISAADTIEILMNGAQVEKLSDERQAPIAESMKGYLEKKFTNQPASELDVLAQRFAEFVGLITSESNISGEDFTEALIGH